MPPTRLESLIGRRLRRAVGPDEPLHDGDIDTSQTAPRS
ncbi:MAG: hypothetical protein ACRDQJ_13900 [Pseudonocardiaceae bacterium]